MLVFRICFGRTGVYSCGFVVLPGNLPAERRACAKAWTVDHGVGHHPSSGALLCPVARLGGNQEDLSLADTLHRAVGALLNPFASFGPQKPCQSQGLGFVETDRGGHRALGEKHPRTTVVNRHLRPTPGGDPGVLVDQGPEKNPARCKPPRPTIAHLQASAEPFFCPSAWPNEAVG